MKVMPTDYWTFFCNPAKWDIDAFLSSGRIYDDYLVTPWQEEWFQPGQLGIIRVGNDTRSKARLSGRRKLKPGVYAIVEVLSPAEPRKEDGDPYWIVDTPKPGTRKKVDIKYIHNLIDAPILIDDINKIPNIQDTYLTNGFQAATMPLDKLSFDTILSLLGKGDEILEKIDEEDVSSNNTIRDLEIKYANAVPEVKYVLSKRIERGKIAKKLKEIAEFRCLICEKQGLNPVGFLKKDRIPYVEAHHVIPVSQNEIGVLSATNIITVCPKHHRQLHYGNSFVVENVVDKIVFQIDGETIEIRKLLIE